ncbi:hypothetical protein ACOWK2_07265, partial [Helicobacter pylori]
MSFSTPLFGLLLGSLLDWCFPLMKKTAKIARLIRKMIARYHIFLVLFASRSAFCFANRFACSNLSHSAFNLASRSAFSFRRKVA